MSVKLLALDTAGTVCSVAVLADGRLLERAAPGERMQAESVLPLVEQLLAETGLHLKELDAIAFGRGPGAFTGLRVAAAVAQGLAYGAGRPVVPVSDLTALAASAMRRHGATRVLVCLDARMQEVYWAAYEAGVDEPVALTEESLSPPAQVAPPPGAWFGAGPGWQAYGALLSKQASVAGMDAALLPGAADIARLAEKAVQRGRTAAPAKALPVYLRDKVATPKL